MSCCSHTASLSQQYKIKSIRICLYLQKYFKAKYTDIKDKLQLCNNKFTVTFGITEAAWLHRAPRKQSNGCGSGSAFILLLLQLICQLLVTATYTTTATILISKGWTVLSDLWQISLHNEKLSTCNIPAGILFLFPFPFLFKAA